MSYVIRLLFDTNGPSEHEGQFVTRFEPDYRDGLGRVWSSGDVGQALRFSDLFAATEFYRQVSTVRPLREDGRLNRPLTALTVTIFDPEAHNDETTARREPQPDRGRESGAAGTDQRD